MKTEFKIVSNSCRQIFEDNCKELMNEGWDSNCDMKVVAIEHQLHFSMLFFREEVIINN